MSARKNDKNILGLMRISVFLMGFSFIFLIIEYMARFSSTEQFDRDFANACLQYALYSLAIPAYAMLAFMGIVPRMKVVKDDYFGWDRIMMQFVIGFMAVLGIQLIFGYFLREIFALVSQLELMLFYFTGALQEVLLFQLLIQESIKGFLNQGKMARTKIPAITSIVVTNVIFMFAHYGVYGSQLNIMLGVFGIGLVFSISFETSKNILIPFLLHGMNNVIALFTRGLATIDIVFIMAFLVFVIMAITSAKLLSREKRNKLEIIERMKNNEIWELESEVKRHDSNIRRFWAILVLSFISIVTIAIYFVILLDIEFISTVNLP